MTETMKNGQKNILTVQEYRDMISGQTAKKSKYGAVAKTVDNIKFHSTREADRYTDLKLMENAGEITGLQRQVKFNLNGVKYFADFCYFDCSKKEWITEDTKGFRTKEYRNKRTQMKNIYNITVLET